MSRQPETGPLVFGGIMLGIWIFLVMVQGPEDTAATVGIWGLVVAGGVYGLRFMEGNARALVAVALGLAAGFGIMVLTMEAHFFGIVSFLWVLGGASLVASGMPAPENRRRDPPAQVD